MKSKITLKLIIDNQDILIMNGLKKGRKVDWEGISKGARYYPATLIFPDKIGKTYEIITNHVDNLMKKNIIQKQEYEIVISHNNMWE